LIEQDFAQMARFLHSPRTQFNEKGGLPMRTHCLSVAAGVILATLFSSGVQANLITNGSFETPVVPVGGFTNFGSGSNGITGWTVVGPQASIVSKNFVSFGITFPAQDGNQWLDLTGFLSNTVEGVQQTVATTPGTNYQLSFAIGNVVNPGGIYGTTSTIDVVVNGTSRGHFTNSAGAGTGTQNWTRIGLTFMATSASTSIEFLNLDPATDNTNGLDNVVLNAVGAPSVPEPATLALVSLGLVGVAASRRHKQR
jgi:hypothetical protein